MKVHWKAKGLRFDPENEAEASFLDEVQALFADTTLSMAKNELDPDVPPLCVGPEDSGRIELDAKPI